MEKSIIEVGGISVVIGKEKQDEKITLFNDEDDRSYYEVAKLCNAILITGNKRHFPDEPFIMTPAEFLETYT